jgi:16S rRNA (uracil1498-N3)-methyltransferase
MADRFYISSPLTLGSITLQGPEAHHLATVCRFRPGDQVCLFNGDGHEYAATVASVTRQGVTLDVTAVAAPFRESALRMEVAAPLPKGDRAQFLLEKLTELGVSTFVPLRTQRSVVHPGVAKLEKLERYVIEASKQCGRNVLLRVEPLADWHDYCARRDLPGARMVAHPAGPTGAWLRGPSVALAVGPEGGFTEQEMERARAHGWQIIDLGPRMLRIETAAIVLAACADRLAFSPA